MSTLENNFSASLKRFRGARSQAEMARLCGIPQQSYNRYEAGTSRPNAGVLLKLAAHFGVTVEELMGDHPAPCVLETPSVYATSREQLEEKAALENFRRAFCAMRKAGIGGKMASLMMHIENLGDRDLSGWNAEAAKSIIEDIKKGFNA